MSDPLNPETSRAVTYAKFKGLAIENTLGSGQDGVVFSTNRRTAIKSFLFFELYRRERDVYLRFKEKGFVKANEFHVPRLIESHDDLWIVEMSIVSPPFIVDFAGARLDAPLRFEPEIMAEWLQDKKEEFESDWPAVKRAMWAFESIGVYLTDVAPRNVRCR
jgi:hypothetical protein